MSPRVHFHCTNPVYPNHDSARQSSRVHHWSLAINMENDVKRSKSHSQWPLNKIQNRRQTWFFRHLSHNQNSNGNTLWLEKLPKKITFFEFFFVFFCDRQVRIKAIIENKQTGVVTAAMSRHGGFVEKLYSWVKFCHFLPVSCLSKQIPSWCSQRWNSVSYEGWVLKKHLTLWTACRRGLEAFESGGFSRKTGA